MRPMSLRTQLTSGVFSNPFASYARRRRPVPRRHRSSPTAGVYISVPPNMKVTYMMQWNLSYQRQVANDWLVTANYLGNATRHIWGSTDVNYAVDPGARRPPRTANTNQRRLTYLANPTTGQYYGDIQQTDDGANCRIPRPAGLAEHRLSHNFTS